MQNYELMDKNCRFFVEICYFDLYGWDSLFVCYDRGKLFYFM